MQNKDVDLKFGGTFGRESSSGGHSIEHRWGGNGSRQAEMSTSENTRSWNKKIKQEVRRLRRRSFEEYIVNLASTSTTEVVSTLSKTLKARVGNRRKNGASTGNIEPDEFTRFVLSQHEQIPGEHFILDENWELDLEWAIKAAPKSKAVGKDQLFAEVLQVDCKLCTELLLALRRTRGKWRIFPTAWWQSRLSPLFKKPPANLLQNWRAVVLPSHGRKIVKKVLERRLRKEYTFHEAQAGFRRGGSTESSSSALWSLKERL